MLLTFVISETSEKNALVPSGGLLKQINYKRARSDHDQCQGQRHVVHVLSARWQRRLDCHYGFWYTIEAEEFETFTRVCLGGQGLYSIG